MFPKGPTSQTLKARKARAEAAMKRAVRKACVKRDEWCRILYQETPPELWGCDGPSEWAHLHSHRRSQTRGQAADKRHTTAGSLMLCRVHHQQYDAHKLRITCLTRKGADGPLKFRRIV
jgi:hypothetical protein